MPYGTSKQFGGDRFGAVGRFGAGRFGEAVAPLYFGAAYNTVTDTWIRVGAGANAVPVGQALPESFSPVLGRLRRVALADNGTVYKGIQWADLTKHDDGTTVDRSGGNGQIMLEMLPSYYKVGVDGNWYYIYFSHLPLPGFSLHPVFTGMSAVYLGAYEASVYSYSGTNKLCSIAKSPADGTSDVYPVTTRSGDWGHAGLTTAVGDTLAAARGTGWQQKDLLTDLYYRQLMIATYASYNIPGIIGAGRINLSGGDWVNGSYIGKCGLGDTPGRAGAVQAGGSSGYATDYSKWLIENPWGNVWNRVSSLVNNGEVYYMPSAVSPTYNYATTTGWTRLLNVAGTGITLPTTSGYAGVPHSGLGLVLPSDVTGSSSTRMRDYYFYSSGLRVLRVSGHSGHGTYAGPFCWSAADAASAADSYIGVRLCFKKAA